MLGFTLAFISSLFFSLYAVPRKLSKSNPLEYSLLMAVGFFVSSAILYLLKPLIQFHEKPSLALLWSLLAGAIWAASFVTFVRSIDVIGLSRSNQWKNLQGPVAAILGLLILSEFQTTRPFIVLLSVIAVFISAVAFTISKTKQEARANLNGVYLAAISGMGFGAVAVIQKHVTTEVGVYTQQVVWSFAILCSIAIYMLMTNKKFPKLNFARVDTRLALGAGLLYLGACFFQLQSYRYLPASIAFTIVQLNAVWTIAIGVFYFKEISVKKHYRRLLVGTIFAVVGILLLAFARR